MLRLTRPLFKGSLRGGTINYHFSTNQQQKNLNVLFFGTDIIAKTVLEALHKNMQHQFKNPVVQSLGVVTSPDIIGKKNQQPVKLFCENKKIPHFQPLSKAKENHSAEWDTLLNETLPSSEAYLGRKFDIGIVCSFGYMIPDKIIDYFSHGMVVLHPSLLPRYRGASPIQYALLNGDKETGITIIEISKGKFDAGKIFIQEKLKIEPTARYNELAMDLAVLGGNRIVDYLDNYAFYQSTGYLQSESEYKKTSAKKFAIEDTFLNWNESTNSEIYNRYRAFYTTGFTTVRTKFNDKWFFIDEMGVVEDGSEEGVLLQNYANAEPGSIWIVKNKKFKNYMYVKCKQGWVVIRGGYMESSQPQPAFKFMNKYINRDEITENNTSKGSFFFN